MISQDHLVFECLGFRTTMIMIVRFPLTTKESRKVMHLLFLSLTMKLM